MGRPRLETDIVTLKLLSKKPMGLRQIAAKYQELTGEAICHMTVKRRLQEAEAIKPQGLRGLLRRRFGFG
jgi:hypothetical protein